MFVKVTRNGKKGWCKSIFISNCYERYPTHLFSVSILCDLHSGENPRLVKKLCF